MTNVFYPLGRAEDMSEGEYQALCDLEPIGPVPAALLVPSGYWRTRDGRTLRVAEMTDAHLQNAIRLFERAGWAEHLKVDELRCELASRL